MLRSIAVLLSVALASQQPAPAATPVEPVTAIIDAFRTHEIVALSDAHGNRQSQLFLEALVRDPRFPTVANDIVWESGARCVEPGYLEERLRRIAITGIPAFEADRARQLCQTK